jgi:hypothetical protein
MVCKTISKTFSIRNPLKLAVNEGRDRHCRYDISMLVHIGRAISTN